MPRLQPPTNCPASQPRLKWKKDKVRGGAWTGRASLRRFQRHRMRRTQPAIPRPRSALRQSQFARSPNRFTLTTLEARCRRTASIIGWWPPRARCCRSCRRGRHRAAFCGFRMPLTAALSLPARATDPPASSDAGLAFQPPGFSNGSGAHRPAPERVRYVEIAQCAASPTFADSERF